MYLIFCVFNLWFYLRSYAYTTIPGVRSSCSKWRCLLVANLHHPLDATMAERRTFTAIILFISRVAIIRLSRGTALLRMRELLGGAVVETLPITTHNYGNVHLTISNSIRFDGAADISRNFDLKFPSAICSLGSL